MRTAWISSIIFSFVAVIGVGVFSFFLISGKTTTDLAQKNARAHLSEDGFSGIVASDSTIEDAPVSASKATIPNTNAPKLISLEARAVPMRPITRQQIIDQNNSNEIFAGEVEPVIAGSQPMLATNPPEDSSAMMDSNTDSSEIVLQQPTVVDDFLEENSPESSLDTTISSKATVPGSSASLAPEERDNEIVNTDGDDDKRQADPNIELVATVAEIATSPIRPSHVKGKRLSIRKGDADPAQDWRVSPPDQEADQVVPDNRAKTEIHTDTATRDIPADSETANDHDIAAFKNAVASLRSSLNTSVPSNDIDNAVESNATVASVPTVNDIKDTLDDISTDLLGRSDKATDDSIAIIVNRQNVENIDIDDIKNIYSDKILTWENGRKITLYNLPLDSMGREVFSRKVLNMSAIQAATEDSNRAITNTASNHSHTKRDRLVLSYVSRNPQAIGYVPLKDAEKNENVRIIKTLH